MNAVSTQFLDLFVRPPGDLFYFLVVFALVQVSLFMAIGHQLRRPAERAARHYTWAAGGMVAAWAALLIGALVALISGQNAAILLPPLERVAQAITVLLLVWAFVTADSDDWALWPTVILLIGVGLCIIGYIVTGVEWASMPAGSQFNLTQSAGTWALVCSTLAASGMGLLIMHIRRIHDAPLKLIACLVVIVGFTITLVQMGNGTLAGNEAGASRLAFAAALIFLPVVLYRLVVATLETEIEIVRGIVPHSAPANEVPSSTSRMTSTAAQPSEAPPVAQQMAAMGAERESAQLMKALGLMLEKATPDAIPERILSAALVSLKADIGALLVVQDANYADVRVGIDRTMNRPLLGTFNLDQQPTLQNAIERRQQRPLYTDRNLDELNDLYARLQIDQRGPVYFQPLVQDRELLAILMVGLPYAGRELTEGEQALLKGIGIIAASLLRLSQASYDASVKAEGRIIQAMVQGVSPADLPEGTALAAVDTLRADLSASHAQIATLNREIADLRLMLDDERSRVTDSLADSEEGKSVSQRLIALNEAHQTALGDRERLSTRLRDAETALATASVLPTGDDDNSALFRTMIDVVNREKTDLAEQRDRLQHQLNALRASAAAPMTQTVREMIERMSEEKARTERERAELSTRLADIEGQMHALGISDGTAGLALLLGELYEQRAMLQVRFEALQADHEALQADYQHKAALITREAERETRLQKIQSDLIRMTADRDAASRKYEKLRAEREEFIARQESLKTNQTQAIAQAAAFESELRRQQAEAQSLRMQIETLTAQRAQIVRERDRLRAERQALEMERDGLLARAEGDRERLAQMGVDGVGALTRMIDDVTAQRQTLEVELAEARTHMAALESRIDMLQLRTGGQPQIVYRPDNPEQFLGMIHELRTPMTSVVGYVDLLLNESAGILGEMQRRFLQRVSNNVSRLHAMLDDLIRISFLDSGRFTLEREPVDLVAVIEETITQASNQLREKGLSMQLNFEDDLPPVIADHDAIQQVVGQLMTNAYLASPVDGDVGVVVRLHRTAQSHDGMSSGAADSLLVSIIDAGGGIAPEDLPRVFARKYRAENPLVQGLGDTGVGLALARALVEAHGGQLWVETETGAGSAFNFTLPLAAATERA